MRCRYCSCVLNDHNRPVAALDFVSEEGKGTVFTVTLPLVSKSVKGIKKFT